MSGADLSWRGRRKAGAADKENLIMQSNDKAVTKIPNRLGLPVEVDESTNELTIWTGEGELRQGAKKRTGVAKILIRMEPRPDICYQFNTSGGVGDDRISRRNRQEEYDSYVH